MKRLFWLGVGVAGGVALSRKARQTAHKATPAGVAANLSGAVHHLAEAIGSFGADVRAGMAEREEELAHVVEQRSGVTPGVRRALGEHERPSSARARRANG